MRIPQSVQELTPNNLTTILQQAGYLSNAHIHDLDVQNASETSGIIGHTARIQLEYAGVTDLPSSLIAKFPTSHLTRHKYFRSLGMYAREVKFYQQLAGSITLNLPHCYIALHDDTTQHTVLLLEDINPAEAGDRVKGCTVDIAEQALRTIAKLHITWWVHPKLKQLNWVQSYNQVAFETQFRKSWTDFQISFQDTISDDLMDLGTFLSHNLDKLSSLWQPPLTLIHRDYNLDNLLFKQEHDAPDSIYVIDWQLVRQGRAVFDIATFLCWNMLPDVRRAYEDHLLHLYYDLLLNAGIRDYLFDDYLADYRRAILECLARIIAILGSNMVTEPHLLVLLKTILERTISAIHDHDGFQFLS